MIKKQFLIPKGASADGTLRPMQGNALLLPTITVSFAMLLKSLFYPWKKINWNPRCMLAKKVKKKIDCKTVCIFAYSSTRKQSNRKSGTRLKTESETGERCCDARALRARKTLTPRVTEFFTDFEKKTDCFAV